MSSQVPLFGVASWPADLRHAILLGSATAATFVLAEVVPQLDGAWLLLVQGVALVVLAVTTPLVQGYGLGQPPTRPAASTTVRGEVLAEPEDVP